MNNYQCECITTNTDIIPSRIGFSVIKAAGIKIGSAVETTLSMTHKRT